MGGRERRRRIGEPLPVRELAGARDPQRVQRRAGDRDRVGGASRIEPERARNAGRDGVGALSGVVEALGAHRRDLGEAVLDLVGDRQRGQQRATVGVRVLGRGEHRSEVVARMAGLPGRQVGVVEVQVAHQRAVVERGTVRRALAPADQRAQRRTAELLAPGRGPSRPAHRSSAPSATPSESSTRSFSCSRAGSEIVIPSRPADKLGEFLDPSRMIPAFEVAIVPGLGHIGCAGGHAIPPMPALEPGTGRTLAGILGAREAAGRGLAQAQGLLARALSRPRRRPLGRACGR